MLSLPVFVNSSNWINLLHPQGQMALHSVKLELVALKFYICRIIYVKQHYFTLQMCSLFSIFQLHEIKNFK